MDTPPVQTAIKLIGFQVSNIDFKLGPSYKIINKSASKEKLNIAIDVRLGFNDEKQKNYSVIFDIKINDDPNNLSLIIKCIALFETKIPITNEFKESTFIKINSPAIAFPFLRSFINTLTTNAGINPIILPAFNFSSEKRTE